MALPASGSISLSQVNTELSKSATATISLNDTDVRALAGIASGTISLASLWGKSASTTKGYWGGGYPGAGTTPTNDIAGLTFSTETLFDPSATLAVARGGNAGLSSSLKAYWGGGYTNVHTNEIDGLIYSTQTAVNPSATLAAARRRASTIASGTKGYWGGGINTDSGTILYSEVDAIVFSTDTASNPSATLSEAKQAPGSWHTSIKGYWAGGGASGDTYPKTIDAFTFSSETMSPLSSTLTPDPNTPANAQIYIPTTCNHSALAGYASYNSFIGTLTDKLTFSTETISVPTAGPTAKDANICTQSSEAGYQTAGSALVFSYPNSYVVYYTSTTKYTFQTETTGSTAATLAQTISGEKTGVSGY